MEGSESSVNTKTNIKPFYCCSISQESFYSCFTLFMIMVYIFKIITGIILCFKPSISPFISILIPLLVMGFLTVAVFSYVGYVKTRNFGNIYSLIHSLALYISSFIGIALGCALFGFYWVTSRDLNSSFYSTWKNVPYSDQIPVLFGIFLPLSWLWSWITYEYYFAIKVNRNGQDASSIIEKDAVDEHENGLVLEMNKDN